MSQSCRHDVFDPTSTIRLRSDSEGVFVRCAECNKAQHWTADYDDDTEPTAGPTAVERAVCPHGSLRRQCEVCERDEEIARLRATERKFGTLMHELMDERDRLRAEVERLTADLASAHEQLADQTARWAAVVNERDALRARIDALMLEYCPDEMTADQTAEWARHQVPHQLSAAEREVLERESAAVDAVATEPKRAYYETHEPPHCPTCGSGASEPNTPAP